MTVAAITDADDPRLADFVALNDPTTRRAVERSGGYFVVEGPTAIERLLGLPDWRVRSLVVLPRLAGRFADAAARAGAPLATAPEELLREVVGFDLHRGALASVHRQAPTPLAEVVRPGGLLVAAFGVNDHENLGALYRNAAAFGASAVVLDERCADPFYRRSVRVSLGNVLAVPTVQVGADLAGLAELHQAGVTSVALSPQGDRPLRSLARTELGAGPVALLVGAEGPGLATSVIEAASHRVSIPMADGVDSLNVATAAAVALFGLSG